MLETAASNSTWYAQYFATIGAGARRCHKCLGNAVQPRCAAACCIAGTQAKAQQAVEKGIRRIEGEEYPDRSLVVAMADVYDAFVSESVYIKKYFPNEKAIEMI